MKRKILPLLAALLFAVVAARAGASWSELQAGMTPAQAQRLVGQPLFSTAGHGYLRWSFDRLGDVTFYRGILVSWTAPGDDDSAPTRAVAGKK